MLTEFISTHKPESKSSCLPTPTPLPSPWSPGQSAKRESFVKSHWVECLMPKSNWSLTTLFRRLDDEQMLPHVWHVSSRWVSSFSEGKPKWISTDIIATGLGGFSTRRRPISEPFHVPIDNKEILNSLHHPNFFTIHQVDASSFQGRAFIAKDELVLYHDWFITNRKGILAYTYI